MSSVSIQIPQSDPDTLVMDGRLLFLDRMFGITWLLFRDSHLKGSPIHKRRLVLAILIMLIVGYQAFYSIWYTANYGKIHLAAALMANCWMFQSLFSIMFVIYWQLNGDFTRIFTCLVMKQDKFAKSAFIRSRLRFLYISFGVFVFAIVSLSLLTDYLYYFADITIVHVEPVILEAFGGPGTGAISMTVVAYGMFVWLTVIVFYMIVSTRVQQELEAFNEKLKKIGEKEEIDAELLASYERQVELSNSLRLINGTFEVYTFLMISSNIPTTIFSILNFVQRLRKTPLAVIFHLPEMSFCIAELVGLTMPASKIYTLVHAAEGILFSNKRIWLPHKESTYQIVHTIIAHSQQTDLGISIWGYALITKSIILTTVSLVITYLALILEMGTNDVVPQIFNATAS